MNRKGADWCIAKANQVNGNAIVDVSGDGQKRHYGTEIFRMSLQPRVPFDDS